MVIGLGAWGLGAYGPGFLAQNWGAGYCVLALTFSEKLPIFPRSPVQNWPILYRPKSDRGLLAALFGHFGDLKSYQGYCCRSKKGLVVTKSFATRRVTGHFWPLADQSRGFLVIFDQILTQGPKNDPKIGAFLVDFDQNHRPIGS